MNGVVFMVMLNQWSCFSKGLGDGDVLAMTVTGSGVEAVVMSRPEVY